MPPTIPTSFVPKQPLQATPVRRQKSGMNLLMLIGISLFGLAVLACAAIFALEFVLTNTRDTKLQQLTQAQQAVNMTEVEEFIRLKGRLAAVTPLLDKHVRISNFFSVLEASTLTSVRFNSLNISVAEDRTAEIRLTGVARSFNALAAQSTEMSKEKRIRRAIFSDISLGEGGRVTFSLAATLDPVVVLGAPQAPLTSDITAPPETNLNESEGVFVPLTEATTTPVAPNIVPPVTNIEPPATVPPAEGSAASTQTTDL